MREKTKTKQNENKPPEVLLKGINILESQIVLNEETIFLIFACHFSVIKFYIQV